MEEINEVGEHYKRCSKCKKLKSKKEYYKNSRTKSGVQSYCRRCAQKFDNSAERKAAKRNHFHGNKRWFKDYWLKKDHGISIEEFDAMRDSQKNLCAICLKPGKIKGLVVDHDHVTGKIRGLLCASCNLFLGRIDQDKTLLNSCLEYLAKSREV